MLLFEEILKEMRLLTEGASINDVNYAISNMHPAIITYTNDNGDKQANGARKIYPIAYGISTAGNPVIRAFEPEGDTTTKVPAWKLFILPNINSWETIGDESFEAMELKGINKQGKDSHMSTLYNVSPLSGSAKQWIDNEPEIKSVPVEKDDVDGNRTYSAEDMANVSVNDAISSKNVDNQPEKDYNEYSPEIKKMSAAPETKPVAKQNISGAQNAEQPENNAQAENEKIYADDDPVSKEEVSGGDEEKKDLTSAYNDMMNRWSNPADE